MPNTITFGEMNVFLVDTTGAGEGNLEVIIKDGYDTLKAQLLKREKRKFEIGFVAERNMKHDVQVIFNGLQIKGLNFFIKKILSFFNLQCNLKDLHSIFFLIHSCHVHLKRCPRRH